MHSGIEAVWCEHVFLSFSKDTACRVVFRESTARQRLFVSRQRPQARPFCVLAHTHPLDAMGGRGWVRCNAVQWE